MLILLHQALQSRQIISLKKEPLDSQMLMQRCYLLKTLLAEDVNFGAGIGAANLTGQTRQQQFFYAGF